MSMNVRGDRLASMTMTMLTVEVKRWKALQQQKKKLGTLPDKEMTEIVSMLSRSVSTFLDATRKQEKNVRDRGKRSTPTERKANVLAYLRSLSTQERDGLLDDLHGGN